MRLFFAIDLPPGERHRLAALVPDPAPGLRLVPPDRMHLTLRFVGQVDPETRETLAYGLRRLAFGGGSIRIRGVGTFPAGGRPRVVWAGVEAGDAVEQAQRDIEALCRRAGIDPDREPWSPHVTLGRVKTGRPSWIDGFLSAKGALASDPIAVGEIVLYDSVPGGPGVRYETVAVCRAP